MVINPIIGFYIPIIRIPIKGGMTVPNIATFDHGTNGTSQKETSLPTIHFRGFLLLVLGRVCCSRLNNPWMHASMPSMEIGLETAVPSECLQKSRKTAIVVCTPKLDMVVEGWFYHPPRVIDLKNLNIFKKENLQIYIPTGHIFSH